VSASGQYSILHAFTDAADGLAPNGLIRDTAGNLYGTTEYGGLPGCIDGCGVVFKVDTSGQETVLYSFTGGADGANPEAGLVEDSAANLYGTTTWGGKGAVAGLGLTGAGVVYKIEP